MSFLFSCCKGSKKDSEVIIKSIEDNIVESNCKNYDEYYKALNNNKDCQDEYKNNANSEYLYSKEIVKNVNLLSLNNNINKEELKCPTSDNFKISKFAQSSYEEVYNKIDCESPLFKKTCMVNKASESCLKDTSQGNVGFSFGLNNIKTSNKTEDGFFLKQIDSKIDFKNELNITIKLKSGDIFYKISKNDRQGSTIFGYKKPIISVDSDINTNNGQADIYLPINLPVDTEIPLFKVNYDNAKSLYFFKSIDSHPSLLIQVKLNPLSKFTINKNDRYLLGDMVFKFEQFNDNKQVVVTRQITKRYNEKISNSFSLEKEGSIITIGRGRSCNMSLNSGLLSRVHASLIYNPKDNLWEIKDGETNKPSSNGCFIFTNSLIPICDGLEVKINEYSIVFNLN